MRFAVGRAGLRRMAAEVKASAGSPIGQRHVRSLMVSTVACLPSPNVTVLLHHRRRWRLAEPEPWGHRQARALAARGLARPARLTGGCDHGVAVTPPGAGTSGGQALRQRFLSCSTRSSVQFISVISGSLVSQDTRYPRCSQTHKPSGVPLSLSTRRQVARMGAIRLSPDKGVIKPAQPTVSTGQPMESPVFPSVLPTYNRADVAFVRGGPYLFAEDGRRYTDFGAGIAVNAFGHANPRLVAALDPGRSAVAHLRPLPGAGGDRCRRSWSTHVRRHGVLHQFR